MKIQNLAMKGELLGLRYTHDENGRPVQVRGDGDGVFDVPEKDGQLLLGTPNWHRPRKTSRALTRPEPVRPVPAPEPEPEPASSGEEPGGEEPEESEEGPDIDGLRTKADALKLAEVWRGKGFDIPELDADTMKLGEMKEALAEAIYADEDEVEETEDADESADGE